MEANISVLEAAGLVNGAPHPDDGRQTIWSLTDACQDRIKADRAALSLSRLAGGGNSPGAA